MINAVRVILLITALGLVSLAGFYFYKVKDNLKEFINSKVLILKICLVSMLIFVAMVSLPFIVSDGYTRLKHALEWNYFVGVITFYLLTFFFWKKQ